MQSDFISGFVFFVWSLLIFFDFHFSKKILLQLTYGRAFVVTQCLISAKQDW